ncbi:type II toxin-antitoxin system HicA family toxin [Hymenobacter antarcticus]|uniref:HicA toxin of toxin-antitoxin n=1 Tax=Hymenobacter antarcticus TaxID=486270 RepID=A0ABP7Q5F2_9BACT
MSRRDKLTERLCKRAKDFTWDELEKLLAAYGFLLLKSGKTGGSRRKFYSETSQEVLDLHKPHPGNILKPYQLDLVTEKLNICQPAVKPSQG